MITEKLVINKISLKRAKILENMHESNYSPSN